MTGSELVGKIRAERPELPVILATGYAELPPGQAEGVPRLAKPFRQQDLVEAIVEAVAG
jgi:FixJ family two-component response regulator